MSVLTKHRFSVAEYYQMGRTGLLKPDSRVELLGGEIIDMSPIGPTHSSRVTRLNRLLSKSSRDRWIVSVQNPLHIDDQSEPEPDILLLKPTADDYETKHPRPADVFLLVEVADASLEYDRQIKVPIYGRAGIPEVWIVNLVENEIEVYYGPHFSGYASTKAIRPGERISPLAFPDLQLDVAEIVRVR